MAKDSFGDEALLGRTIAGKFAIETYVGGGAMGAVYKAKQLALDKTIAIKVMHREMAKDEKFVARFKREAKAASKLDHPNSLRVIDFGEEPDGLLYLAMEFLDGKDLFAVIKEGWPLTDERIVSILIQALAALAIAHDQGIVHRDLKPENIMILAGHDDEGNAHDIVKVCDFGIAKITERVAVDKKSTDSARLSTKGLVVGTPEYMSPEQGRGEPLDSRSDLYSMGIILYQLLTRRVPFDAESAIGIVLKHVTEEPARPSTHYANVNPKLEVICLKALQKKKEERYQTAREMRADLKAAIDPSLASVAIGVRPRSTSAPDTQPMENAATIPIDLRAVTATAREPMMPTSSKVTPIGTEALDDPPSGRRAGYLLAALFIGGVGFGGWELWRHANEQTALPTATTTQTHATSPPPTLEPTAEHEKPIVTSDPSEHERAVTLPSATAHASAIPLAMPSALTNNHAMPAHSAIVPVATASIAPVATVAASTAPIPAPPTTKGPSVRIGQPKNIVGSVDAHALRMTLASAYARFNACFVNGVQAGDKVQSFTADLHLNLSGPQSRATMAVPTDLAKTGQCVMNVASDVLAAGPDTGSADVPIEFVPSS
ncbi:MAG TPA: protein kinase [Polyangiaceae bacterium]|jgi:serine/threonine-protein kinase